MTAIAVRAARGCHRFDMKSEYCMRAGALMIHPSLCIMPMEFSEPEETHAVLVVVHHKFFKASHHEFFFPDVFIQLKRLAESKFLLSIE